MRRALSVAAIAALVAAPAAAAPGPPRLFRFEGAARLYLVLDTTRPPLSDPALQRAIALCLDRHALVLGTPRGPRYAAQPLEPKYVTPAALTEARRLAAAYAGTTLHTVFYRSVAGLPRLEALEFQLAQIGIALDVYVSRGVVRGGVPPAEVEFVAFVPDYPRQRLERQLRRPGLVAIPVGRYTDHVMVSGRVAHVTYNRVYGVDLAALALH